MEVQSNPTPANQAERFVNYVIQQLDIDSGFSARLKRADNNATEFHSWEFLAAFNIDLENPWQRLPYCTIAAALAKAKVKQDGSLPFGRALAACFPNGNQDDPAKARLRRLLSCDNPEELCGILRQYLALIRSREVAPNHLKLLKQMLAYRGERRQNIRTQWATEFFSQPKKTEQQGETS